jgi:Bacterial pre-peptidase C-terminal domain
MSLSLRLIAVGFAVAAISSLQGCGSSAKPAPGMGCALNSDCASGLVCTFGLCHSACAVNGDCPAGTLCLRSGSVGDGGGINVCQLSVETKCVYNSNCTSPLVCARDEQCRNQCQTDVDCVSPQICTSSKVCALTSQLAPGTSDVPIVTSGLDGGTGGGAAGGAAGGASGNAGHSGGGKSGSGGAGGGSGGSRDAGPDSTQGGTVDGGVVLGDPCGAPADAGGYLPESVPNNDRQHATTLSVAAGYGACIQTGTDVDWYTITTPSIGQGGYLTIAVTAVAQNALLRSDLYSASTNGLIYTTNSPNPGSSIYTWIAAAPGAPFNFAVYGFYMDSRAVGAYTITVAFQAAVEPNEPNNDRAHATPVTLGTPIQGLYFRGYVDDATITDPSDYYKVTLPAAGIVTAAVTNISASVRGGVTLFDASGGQLATAISANGTAGADAVLTYSAPAAGSYYVYVGEPFIGDIPLVGSGRTLPDVATHPYTLTVTSQ